MPLGTASDLPRCSDTALNYSAWIMLVASKCFSDTRVCLELKLGPRASCCGMVCFCSHAALLLGKHNSEILSVVHLYQKGCPGHMCLALSLTHNMCLANSHSRRNRRFGLRNASHQIWRHRFVTIVSGPWTDNAILAGEYSKMLRFGTHKAG